MNYTKSTVASLVILISSAGAFAAEMNAGTIHFTGQIIEPSCTIEGDDGTDTTVPLGTYPKSVFTEVGKETDLMDFAITLADCPLKSDGLPSVQLTFNGQTALTGSKTLLDVSKITTDGAAAAKGIGIAVSPAGMPPNLLPLTAARSRCISPCQRLKTTSSMQTSRRGINRFPLPWSRVQPMPI